VFDHEIGKIYKNGEIICFEGEEGQNMFVIQSGKVKVIKNFPDGEVAIATLQAGDIFGEMALFDHLPRSASVKAEGEAVVLSVDFAKASKDPNLTFNILEGMSRKIRTLNNQVCKLKNNREEGLESFTDISRTGKLILEEIRNSIKSDNGSVMLLDESKKSLSIIAAFGKESDEKTDLCIGAGIAGDVIKTGKIEMINDISTDRRFIPGKLKIEAILCSPLRDKNKVFGVINLSHNKKRYFNLDDLKLLRVFSNYTSFAIENAKLFSRTRSITNSIINQVSLLDMV